MPSLANELPTEIWLEIAAELSPITSRKSTGCPIPRELIGVHRTFFTLYMHHKYGDIHWTVLDKNTMRVLRRLQEPVFARHVRRLQIYAWFIEYLMKRDVGFQEKAGLDYVQSKFLSLFSNLKPVAGGGDYTTVSSKTVMDLMISAIRNMRNVEEYAFELRDLSLTKDSERFLLTVRQAFGSSLRKLSLHSTISKFKSIVHLTDFNILDELRLSFDYHSLGTSDPSQIEASKDAERRELMDAVVPFLNLQKDSLTSLTIASSSYTDLTPFFQRIGPFPCLRRFSANIFMDEPHLSDMGAFIRFLHTHRSSLFYLDLKARTPDANFVSLQDSLERRERSWARAQIALLRENRELLSSLEALHIPCWNIDATINILTQCRSRSLTHLSLTDRPLSLNELSRVLNVFVRNPFQLQSLLVNVDRISVDCLKLLSSRLPGLRSLVLFFHDFAEPELFVQTLPHVKPGEIDWDALQHLTVYSRYNISGAGIGAEDAELLNMACTVGWSLAARYSVMIAKKLPSVKSYRAVPWHLQLVNSSI